MGIKERKKGGADADTGRKWARLERLLLLEHRLYQNPQGLTFQEMADLFKVSVRTARRYVNILESIGVPIWESKGGRRGWAREGNVLPPIHLTLSEAMTIFLASRLLLSYSNAYNPSIEGTFTKLNSVVPEPIRDQIRNTIAWMKRQKIDEHFVRIFDTLSRAWLQRRRVMIKYRTLGQEVPLERTVEPYFIQPAALEHANYLLAYCHLKKSVRTFKIERIEEAKLLDEKYDIPADFDANEYLGSSWGITAYGEAETIRLKFSPEIARIAQETLWHPSQITQMRPDGSAIVTMNLPITVELESFILGWGEKVEVLEPEKLRRRILETARAIIRVSQGSRGL